MKIRESDSDGVEIVPQVPAELRAPKPKKTKTIDESKYLIIISFDIILTFH